MSASHRISLSGAGGEDAASVSPDLSLDGRWLAYVQLDYLGGREVYVQAFPNPGAKWQISSDGLRVPIWSPDGRELFYQTDDGAVSVNVDTTSEFTPGTPRPLFRLPAGSGIGYEFHIAPDGERFVLTAFDDEAAVLRERQLHVVLNWFEELERLFRRTRQHRSSQKESKKHLTGFARRNGSRCGRVLKQRSRTQHRSWRHSDRTF